MADLRGLHERIAALTGPDREVDALVEVAFFPEERGAEDHVYAQMPTVYNEYDEGDAERGDYWRISRSGRQLCYSKPVTGSLDAAVALVGRVLPPAWVRLDNWTAEHNGASAAILPKPTPNATYGATGPTMPLALLKALLAALKEIGE